MVVLVVAKRKHWFKISYVAISVAFRFHTLMFLWKTAPDVDRFHITLSVSKSGLVDAFAE